LDAAAFLAMGRVALTAELKQQVGFAHGAIVAVAAAAQEASA
jgi:hypothetical protein